jgi:integrase/recombinase XerD
VVNAEGRVKDEIRLNADQTKGGHPRIVFLSRKLLKELEAYVCTAKRREAHWAFFAKQ